MERYKSAALQPGQVTEPRGAIAATSIAAQSFENLGTKLNQFSSMALKQYATQRLGKAREQAAIDDAQGKPYHKESIYTVYGKAYNNTRSATFAANAELDLTTKSQEFAYQFKNQPDSYANAMSEYRDKLALDAPTAELGNVIAISGRKIQNYQFGKLSIAKSETMNKEKLQTFNDFIGLQIGRAVNAKANGNTKDLDLISEYTREYANAMVLEGAIDQAQANKYIEDAEYKVNLGSQEQIMRDLLNEGKYKEAESMIDYETPEGADYTQHQAITSSLQTIYNSGIKKYEANIKETQKENDVKGKEGAKILKAGKVPTNLTELRSLPMSEKVAHELNLQIQVQSMIKPFQQMSLPDQVVEFNKRKATMFGDEVSIELIDEIGKTLQERTRLAKNDPVSLSQQEGLTGEEPVTLILGDRDFIANLAQRAKDSPVLQASYGKGATQLFTSAEAQQFASYLESPTTSIPEKLNLISQIEQGAGKQSGSVYAQIAGKGAPVTAMAGSLINKGQSEIANKVLEGQMILKEIPGLVDYELLNPKISKTLKNALQFSGEGSRAAIYKSAAALYASVAEETGKTDKNYTGINKIIESLTGGMGRRSGQTYFLPQGYNEDQADDFIDELTIKDIDDVASISKKSALDMIKTGQLVSIGNSKYAIRKNGKWLIGADKNKYVLEIK